MSFSLPHDDDNDNDNDLHYICTLKFAVLLHNPLASTTFNHTIWSRIKTSSTNSCLSRHLYRAKADIQLLGQKCFFSSLLSSCFFETSIPIHQSLFFFSYLYLYLFCSCPSRCIPYQRSAKNPLHTSTHTTFFLFLFFSLPVSLARARRTCAQIQVPSTLPKKKQRTIYIILITHNYIYIFFCALTFPLSLSCFV